MKRYILFLVSLFAGFFAIGIVALRLAHATVIVDAVPSDAATTSQDAAVIVAGSGSAVVTTTTTTVVAPADQLHDPVQQPIAAIDDVRAAAKTSWPLAIIAVLILVTKALSYVGGKLAPLGRWLSTARNAMIVAAVGTLLATAYNTMFAGGSWYAVLVAVGGSLLALLSPTAPAARER